MNLDEIRKKLIGKAFERDALIISDDKLTVSDVVLGRSPNGTDFEGTTIINTTGCAITQFYSCGTTITHQPTNLAELEKDIQDLCNIYPDHLIIHRYRYVGGKNRLSNSAHNLSYEMRVKAEQLVAGTSVPRQFTGRLAKHKDDSVYAVTIQAIPMVTIEIAAERGIYLQSSGHAFVKTSLYEIYGNINLPGQLGLGSGGERFIPVAYVSDPNHTLEVNTLYTPLTGLVYGVDVVRDPEIPEGVYNIDSIGASLETTPIIHRKSNLTAASLEALNIFKTLEACTAYIAGNTPEELKRKFELEQAHYRSIKHAEDVEKRIIDRNIEKEQSMIDRRIQETKNYGETIKGVTALIVAGLTMFKLFG